MYSVELPILRGQVTPRGTGSHIPEACIHKNSIVVSVGAAPSTHKFIDYRLDS
jgi:hypothetical protein